jgi:thiaminase/transcriptional activator TenA
MTLLYPSNRNELPANPLARSACSNATTPLAAVPAPSTLEYLALLGRIDTSPTPVALVALWALERVYRDAWQAAAPGAEPYREIVAHWTEPGFADYVAALEHLADTALTDSPSAEQQTVFDEVLRLEIAFWDAGTATG